MTTSPPGQLMAQSAPYPEALADLVASLSYRPGWTFQLAHITRDTGPEGERLAEGLTLIVTTLTTDSYHPENTRYRVAHYFPVPAATYDQRSWRRWLLEQLLLVERHEACEFFEIAGQRPYAPSHGPGNDPYLVRELGTEIDQRTSFRGALNPR